MGRKRYRPRFNLSAHGLVDLIRSKITDPFFETKPVRVLIVDEVGIFEPVEMVWDGEEDCFFLIADKQQEVQVS